MRVPRTQSCLYDEGFGSGARYFQTFGGFVLIRVFYHALTLDDSALGALGVFCRDRGGFQCFGSSEVFTLGARMAPRERK